MIEFTDGMKFDTDGPEYKLVCRRDGWYVVGRGLLYPVDSEAEGEKIIAKLTEAGGRK